jgi:methylated-DNA-protein-cysteine methyltransferase-like protein
VKSRHPREFTARAADLIRSIPSGLVASYGFIASLAGDARQARQVAWILHSSSEKQRLPWHRVVNSEGKISLPPERGGRLQRRRLASEGVRFDRRGFIDLRKYGWNPGRGPSRALARLDLDRLT